MQIEPSESSIITASKVLLVEGQDEVKFFEALLKHLGIKKNVQIHEVGGKDKFPIIPKTKKKPNCMYFYQPCTRQQPASD